MLGAEIKVKYYLTNGTPNNNDNNTRCLSGAHAPQQTIRRVK